jgi:hypothetical protein
MISLLSSIVGGLIVAFVNHAMTKRREHDRSKHELNLKYLIEAWRNLSKGSRDDVEIWEKASALEKGIEDVQLFGSAEQIKMAQLMAQEMTTKGSSNTTPLLHNLRNDIRRELRLENVAEAEFFFRITPTIPRPSRPEK